MHCTNAKNVWKLMIAMKKKECDSFCKIYFEVSSDETVVLGVLGFF